MKVRGIAVLHLLQVPSANNSSLALNGPLNRPILCRLLVLDYDKALVEVNIVDGSL